MKAVQLLAVMVICAIAPELARAENGRAARLSLFGNTYVPLGDWAGRNGFSARWMTVGDTVQLTNPSARLFFSRDSREAEINGVKVYLSLPVIFRNSVDYISQMDLDTTINPLLFPSRNTRKIRNIVIDPGHGGKDPGNQDGSHQEKTYTLLLAQELRNQLNQAGFNASLTRTSDTFVELPMRPDIARRRGADLFISLHWNALPGNRAFKGSQVYCLTPAGASSSNAGGSMIGAGRSPGNRNDAKNMLLAYSLQRALLQHIGGVEDRGVRRARYWVLRVAEMPGVLIEGGFMSNPTESRRIYDAGYRREMARAILAGILDYKRQVE